MSGLLADIPSACDFDFPGKIPGVEPRSLHCVPEALLPALLCFMLLPLLGSLFLCLFSPVQVATQSNFGLKGVNLPSRCLSRISTWPFDMMYFEPFLLSLFQLLLVKAKLVHY